VLLEGRQRAQLTQLELATLAEEAARAARQPVSKSDPAEERTRRVSRDGATQCANASSLASRSSSIYWTSYATGTIGRANLDGTACRRRGVRCDDCLTELES
jgi:hypothetical protein